MVSPTLSTWPFGRESSSVSSSGFLPLPSLSLPCHSLPPFLSLSISNLIEAHQSHLYSSPSSSALREMVISPALLLLRPTEDHRRRYLLAKLASPKHYDASDPPLGQERWSHIRYRRLIDSGITGGMLGLGAPKFHRKLSSRSLSLPSHLPPSFSPSPFLLLLLLLTSHPL